MFSKDDYILALKKLGFEQEKSGRCDGSHKNYVHTKYKNLKICLVDHKNTKELSNLVHNELISCLTLVVVLESYAYGKIDLVYAKSLLKGIDKNMAQTILNKIKKLNVGSDDYLLNLLPRKLLEEMRKFIDSVTNAEVTAFLGNI